MDLEMIRVFAGWCTVIKTVQTDLQLMYPKPVRILGSFPHSESFVVFPVTIYATIPKIYQGRTE